MSVITTFAEFVYLVRIDLKLRLQDRTRDVVDEICGAHLVAAAEKTPASVGIVQIANCVRCSVDDCSQIAEVIHGGCSHDNRREKDASNKHGSESQADLSMRCKLTSVERRLAGVASGQE